MLLNREAASKYLDNHENELVGFVVHEIIHITTLVVGPNYDPNKSPRAGRRVGAFLTTTPVDPAWRDRTSVVHLELCDSAAILLLLLILIRIPLVLSLPRIITRPLLVSSSLITISPPSSPSPWLFGGGFDGKS